jgi:hypothetical protein
MAWLYAITAFTYCVAIKVLYKGVYQFGKRKALTAQTYKLPLCVCVKQSM